MELNVESDSLGDEVRPVGIKAVAAVAGVSIGTVSHVLNHPERVSPELRERVLAVVKHLGYVPDEAARQLRSRRRRPDVGELERTTTPEGRATT